MTKDWNSQGEPWRKLLGIDGTAGDAQDVPHPYIWGEPNDPCVVCGLAATHRAHTGGIDPKPALIGKSDRDVLLRIALGDDGWQEQVEHRFVHRETGQAVTIFDARVHGSIFDWRSEERRVIEMDWEPKS